MIYRLDGLMQQHAQNAGLVHSKLDESARKLEGIERLLRQASETERSRERRLHMVRTIELGRLTERLKGKRLTD